MREPATEIEPFDFGQLLVRNSLISESALEECLEAQREVARRGVDAIPRLGELLVARGYLTEEQVVSVLSQQEMAILFCPRCEVQVNVPVREDVREVRCVRCRGTLIVPREPRDLKVTEDSIIFISREPVPSEVEEASRESWRKFGKYTLINEIGRGGAGVVHRAWDHYLNQFVALKRIHPEPPPGRRGRAAIEERVATLLKEARAAARLRHPNIVTVHEVGRVDREYYVSMEYLEGATLADHLRKAREEGKVSPFFEQPRKYLHLFRDVARALHYAHTRPSPIIHCDLKPSNVFVERSGRATVLDFGLAKTQLEADPAGLVKGSPKYMAPEQASGHPEDIDPRTDIYGLGAVLYETLTGRAPFGGSLSEVLRDALVEPARPPADVLAEGGWASLAARLPVGISEVCLKCLEKDRAARYGSAIELVEALQEVLRKETPPLEPRATAPMEARPAPAPRRPGGFIGLAAAAGLMAGIGITLLLGGPARSEVPGDSEALRREVEAAVERFRPDSAMEFCRAELARAPGAARREKAEGLLERAEWIERMRGGLIEALNRTRPTLPALRLRGEELAPAEVLKATRDGLVVFRGGESRDVEWSRLAPEQVVALVRGWGGTLGEAERFGLALYAAGTGQSRAAREELEKLRGGALEIPAARERSRIGD
jgi:serine/threonine protein kinase